MFGFLGWSDEEDESSEMGDLGERYCQSRLMFENETQAIHAHFYPIA